MYSYDDVLLFAKIVDLGNFVAVAQSLNIAQSTVSRRIKLLEESLGVKLFQYEGKKAIPTDSGVRLYNKVKNYGNIFNDFDNFIDDLRQEKDAPSGEICVVMPSGVALVFITKYVMIFKLAYPKIKLNIIYLDSYLDFDLIKDNYDLVITNHIPKKKYQNDYKLSSLITVQIGLYCTKDYEKKYGLPKSPSDLKKHQFLGYITADGVKTNSIKFTDMKTGKVLIHDVDCFMYTNHSTNVVDLVYSHELIVGMHSYNAKPDLIRVLPDYVVNDAKNAINSLYLVKHPYRNNLANRLFTDFIIYLFELHKQECTNIRASLEEYVRNNVD